MIRFANDNDIPDIMRFIDEHWAKGHILSVNKELFLFQHKYGEEISFVVSTDERNQINGLLGYIPYGTDSTRDVMLALWKALHSDVPMLGVQILQFLMRNGGCRCISAVGINPHTTIALYQFLGYKTGKMQHWYRLKRDVVYKIAHVVDNTLPYPVVPQGKYHLVRYETFCDVDREFDFDSYTRETASPYKESSFIKRRYFEHPVYTYEVYGVTKHGEKTKLLLVFRKQPCNDSIALRLVDCIGNYGLLSYVTSDIDNLLSLYGAEYVDIYEAGLTKNILLDGGWLQVANTPNVIPDHFAPYECKNVDLYYCSQDKDVVLFKGDGDQDRPN